MSARFWFRGPDQDLVELPGRIRNGWEFAEAAEEGRTNVNTIIIDDPRGELTELGLKGHRIFAIEETDAEDPENRFIGIGYIGKIRIERGPYRTAKGCQWVCEVADLNTVFNRRVMLGDGNKRTGESDNARVAWVEGTHEGELIDDTRYLTSLNPSAMSETNYLLQPALSVYSDASQQSGKNFFLTYFGDVGVDARNPWGSFSLFYDFAHAEVYVSDVGLSNVWSDVDFDTVYPLFIEDTALEIDPMRQYSTVAVPYRTSYVTSSRDATRIAYARRDIVMNAPNVTTKAAAKARANRYVADAATPEHRATVQTIVPRAHVNRIRPGMLIPVRASYWPGYDPEPVYMRILDRRVIDISESDGMAYVLKLVVSRAEPGPPAPATFGTLDEAHGLYQTEHGSNLIYFKAPGDTPPNGWPIEPTTALITPLVDGSPPNANWPIYGWEVNGDGTLDLEFFASAAGVIDEATYTVTWAISLNGTIVAAESQTPSGDGLEYWSGEQSVTITDLAVANGDVLTCHVTCSPPMPGHLVVPAGTGGLTERFAVTGGSLS